MLNDGERAVTATGAVLAWGRVTPSQTAQASDSDPDGYRAQARALPLPRDVEAAVVDAGQRHLVVLTGRAELLTLGVDPAGKPLPDADVPEAGTTEA
jgi:alpha-tubulin suppressor-like RCC1 family protein